MKTHGLLICALTIAFSLAAENALTAASKEKVILDTDMVDSFDDGVAMVILANAPDIELLGVTTVSGNSWVSEGVASALRQLDIEKQTSVPVASGLNLPLRSNRHELFSLERQVFGQGDDTWVGSFGYPDPGSWRKVYLERYGEEPRLAPIDQHAVNFIIDTVRAHPGEVTIAAIGPCGNLALAVRMAPDIVPLIKRVVYMGGSFFQTGNITPAAEFNFYFDPEAAKITVRSPFKEQTLVGLKVSEKVIFTRDHYDGILKTLGKSGQADLLRASFLGKSFEADPNFTFFVWDVISAAIIIDPTLIVKEEHSYIDVNDQYGLSYGQSLAFREKNPPMTQKANIVLDIDENRFWELLTDRKYWASARD
ncbi:MAG: nucleoside hydrolase [Deltaproteobacteria bacterium]|jgi:inosine-uridine nucleoside N-ribohydrolase|nr:nucleoside hydrolase [Deltaproteobacteria bacterium]